MTKHNTASSGSAEFFCQNSQIVDFLRLPSVPFNNRASLPNECGVYFVIDSNNVLQYIGYSNSIRTRLTDRNHRLLSLKLNYLGFRVAYFLLTNKTLARAYEIILIDFYKPPLNLVRYTRLLKRSFLLLDSEFDPEIASKLTLKRFLTLSLESWERLENLATKLGFDSIENFLENLSLKD
ncbi:MAG: hypothetical protein EAZ73_08985 [Oscillatoriales cyanobacterium]|uniref:hypothetical protein n=1 Tax=unclassified Microcoleus TaxID=2642155 RepID=UPI001E0360DD|nr:MULTISPECIES: hypothetical protein [unclassified Microcoleus]TAF00888.1 MAG: hypothetical protein EAZ79_01615 [Oscillatoriales cyanobacterium]MCC3459771.1 hypothetical protein [Microcoleus sp. PH2017_11_PCY_U_A]MCC3478204.1 hypothetical protein [Microcoleus sp. PH2017_12_PCY_D_A]TAF21354.1 MAG: hypothetical protein EAZ73_08985 [Oscillatoriales cyanobacterium]TAF39719.1 MAG: hypothetical protein EAZ69_00360 [Oscillatoriales cyanobacterium]